MTISKPPHYLRWVLLVFGVGSALVIALVLLVDPYNLYGILAKRGLNEVKPALTRYQNEIKLTQALHRHATQFILGNSRAEIGFDPEAPVFRQGGPAYNLAIAGTGMETSLGQLEYLREQGVKPKTVVLGLEFLDFMEAPPLKPQVQASTASAETPAAVAGPHPAARLFWRFDTLYSLTSVKDALHTIAIQHDTEAETMSAGGFNPLLQYQKFARVDGYYQMFAQRARENVRTYTRKASGSFARRDARRQVRALLDILGEASTDTHLIIYPYHAQIMLLFEETGLFPAFSEWKDILVEEVAAARVRYSDARIALHDFSGFGTYNCEAIPEKDEPQATTEWYWEGGHFKKALGDIVLAQTLSTSPNADFGTLLDDSTKSQNQQRIAAERIVCADKNPRLFTETRRLVREYHNSRNAKTDMITD